MVRDAARRLSQKVNRAAAATTSAAAAAGGAAVNGVVGGVTGAVSGIQRGVGSKGAAVPAAVLTLGVVGATGLVEWPVVLAIGAGALMLRQLSRHDKDGAPAKAAPAKSGSSTPPAKSGGSTQSAARKPQRTTAAKKAPAKKASRSRSATARR
ncbi:hypothetical protein AWC26_07665 [Mycobacterium shimoidei]|uniref:Uncharacterized protein n=1 Tax=Mycobacterium shimoidei TaxID=29313 RepID=A0A1E3TC11_MYCSH|nr:hypothetical protein [Mycobacterium shimoidei]ODR11962.1 hypothetical protein BHQ16_17875 [Mycobacterium shimoidei]ORW81510.1 hypothetical protein AWC26_07665 [Mycobacterium shimoidei]SRX92365.1 hypothetical protein MSP7336_00590 [Mycobacterium shimoidei]